MMSAVPNTAAFPCEPQFFQLNIENYVLSVFCTVLVMCDFVCPRVSIILTAKMNGFQAKRLLLMRSGM